MFKMKSQFDFNKICDSDSVAVRTTGCKSAFNSLRAIAWCLRRCVQRTTLPIFCTQTARSSPCDRL